MAGAMSRAVLNPSFAPTQPMASAMAVATAPPAVLPPVVVSAPVETDDVGVGAACGAGAACGVGGVGALSSPPRAGRSPGRKRHRPRGPSRAGSLVNMMSLLGKAPPADAHAPDETAADFVAAADELAANFSMDGIDATFVDEEDEDFSDD